MKLTLSQIRTALPPIAELRDLADTLLARGGTPAAVVDEIVEFLDDLIDWHALIKGPAGVAIEAGDGPLLRGIVRVIVAHVARKRGAA